MAGENEAVPTVEVRVEPAVNSTTSTVSAPPKTVQGQVLARAPRARWKWSKKKKEALRHVLAGSSVVAAAERVGVHRNTLTAWMKAPEWTAEVQRALSEEQTSSKLKRVKLTAAIADQLGAKALRELQKDDLGSIDPGRAGLVLREHLNYVKAERDLYGETGQQGQQPGLVINIGAPGANGTPAVSSERAATAVLSFATFMEAYDPQLAVVARSPQEAAALLMEKALQESPLLDHIREEDREQFRREAESEEANKKRR